MGKRKEIAFYNRRVHDLVGGKMVVHISTEEVRVLARAEGYAMVRKKACAPFSVRESDLVAMEPK